MAAEFWAVDVAAPAKVLDISQVKVLICQNHMSSDRLENGQQLTPYPFWETETVFQHAQGDEGLLSLRSAELQRRTRLLGGERARNDPWIFKEEVMSRITQSG